jgi:hypothetical protein
MENHVHYRILPSDNDLPVAQIANREIEKTVKTYIRQPENIGIAGNLFVLGINLTMFGEARIPEKTDISRPDPRLLPATFNSRRIFSV